MHDRGVDRPNGDPFNSPLIIVVMSHLRGVNSPTTIVLADSLSITLFSNLFRICVPDLCEK
jgi:hypothetical protein